LAETNEDDIAAYLGKPFELTTLLKTVKTVLIEHRDFLIEKNKPLQKPWEAKQATYH
jgi:hypothetical protein